MANSNKQTSTYPITKRNKAKRMRERAQYDVEVVHELLDSALLCHIAYVIDGQPYCTPTTFWREGNDVIWHGSVGSKMLMAQAKGIDVCLTVSFLDGLVLTRSAFHHAVNYRSVMLFGRASVIADPDEKRQAALHLIDNYLPDRNDLVVPATPQEMKQAVFLRMPIDEAVAKVRNHPASHEPGDNRDQQVWAGDIRVEMRLGAPIPASDLSPGIEPSPDILWYKEGARLDSTLLEVRRRAGRTLD